MNRARRSIPSSSSTPMHWTSLMPWIGSVSGATFGDHCMASPYCSRTTSTPPIRCRPARAHRPWWANLRQRMPISCSVSGTRALSFSAKPTSVNGRPFATRPYLLAGVAVVVKPKTLMCSAVTCAAQVPAPQRPPPPVLPRWPSAPKPPARSSARRR
ncbi:hypothetical protein D3C73_945830 [compost metagenome]